MQKCAEKVKKESVQNCKRPDVHKSEPIIQQRTLEVTYKDTFTKYFFFKKCVKGKVIDKQKYAYGDLLGLSFKIKNLKMNKNSDKTNGF